MPVLARMRAGGSMARLRAADPHAPEVMWTTVATGRQPLNHDVAGRWTPREDGGGLREIGAASWAAPAYWQVLEEAGRKTATLFWPATMQATAWPGVHIDPRFAPSNGPAFDSWAIPPGSVSPETMRETLRDARMHVTEVDAAMLAPFVPGLADIDQKRDHRLTQLALMLAGAATGQGAATKLLEGGDWDVFSVHFSWLDFVQRTFLEAPPPYDGVVDAAYAFTDSLLGRLIDLAGPDTTVFVVSPNGVRAGPEMTWRAGGFLAARGRWIAAGQELPPLRLVDIAPCILARFGLSVPLDGKPVMALAPGQSRRRVDVKPRPKPLPDRHVQALRALGYRDIVTEADAKALAKAQADRLIARAEVCLAAGKGAQAETALRAARALLPPDDPSGLERLGMCYVYKGDAAGSHQVGAELMRLRPGSAWTDLIMASAFALEGKAAQAWPFMIAAREKAGDDPQIRSRIGGIALILEEDVSAAAHFEAALRLDLDLEFARKGLELARALGERRDGAASAP